MAEEKYEYEVDVDEGFTPNKGKPVENEVEAKGKPDIDIEIEDDTPESDRNRKPLPRNIVEELEADELDEYSDKAKERLRQMKKVWHDERRAKDEAAREREEALAFAKNALEENRRLKSRLTEGEKSFIDTAKGAAELEMEMAKRAYKEAYDAGDSDKLVEAQEQLSNVNYKLQQIKNYRPPLQTQEIPVNSPQEQFSRPDPKASSWQERNPWFGKDSTVVAPASRSTSSKKIVLKQSQLMIAKKLGLTPEQYAREFAKTQEN